MANDRRNPWNVPAEGVGLHRRAWWKQKSGRIWPWVAAAVLAGVGLGIFLPSARPGQQAARQPAAPTLPVDRPDAGRELRDFRIEPSREPDSEIPPDRSSPEAAPAAFGFCRGRVGSNCVIDGDSFILGDEAIRLGLIDAPELGDPACEAERALATRAEQRLHALLNSGAVSLEPVGDHDRDRFGRLLRDARVDGQSVSDILIGEGLARPWQGRKETWC